MNMTYTFGTPEGSVGPDGYSLDNWAKNSYSLFGCRLWR
jgi:hypothetical protein